jgi:hypothetical protein
MARRAPRVGDLFTVRERELVGRVVSTTAVVGPTHGCVLVYVYADARLSRDALLVPPLLTTRAPWSHGLFEPLLAGPLRPGQALERHSFRDARGRLFDEEGRPLEAPAEPVGEYKLFEVDAIAAALARAPGGYPVPPPDAAAADDDGAALRAIVARWIARFGRPPTRAEWQSLYDVAVEPEEDDPRGTS